MSRQRPLGVQSDSLPGRQHATRPSLRPPAAMRRPSGAAVLLAKRPGTQQAYDLAGLQSAVERTSAIAGQEHCAERLDRVKPLGRLTFRAIRRCLGIELATVFQGCHGPSRRCSLSPMVPRQSGTDNVAYCLSFSARCPSIAPRLSAVAVNIYRRQRKPGSRHFALADSALSLQCRHRLQPATVPYASRVRPSNYQEVTP